MPTRIAMAPPRGSRPESSHHRRKRSGRKGLIVRRRGSRGCPSRPSPARPDEAIRTLLNGQVADWNRKDLDGFCRGYWNSPDLVFLSGGEKTRGWTAMRDRYRARYQAEGRAMGSLAFREVEVEPLGPDSAFARGRWDLEFGDGKAAGGRFTLILRKTAEGWRIVHDHTSLGRRSRDGPSAHRDADPTCGRATGPSRFCRIRTDRSRTRHGTARSPPRRETPRRWTVPQIRPGKVQNTTRHAPRRGPASSTTPRGVRGELRHPARDRAGVPNDRLGVTTPRPPRRGAG